MDRATLIPLSRNPPCTDTAEASECLAPPGLIPPCPDQAAGLLPHTSASACEKESASPFDALSSPYAGWLSPVSGR